MSIKPTYEELEKRVRQLQAELAKQECGGSGQREAYPTVASPEPVENIGDVKIHSVESESFSELLLKTIPYGIDIVDEHGEVLYQNNYIKTIFNQEANGLKCWDVYRENKSQCDHCPLKSDIVVGQTETMESDNIVGGRVFEITHTGMMFRGKRALLEIFHDITHKKFIEQELVHAKEKAEENDKLKSAFLQNISHEVRTPLNSIIGFSHLITRPNQLPEKLETYAKTIKVNTDKLIDIITDVIDISQIQARQTVVKLTDFDVVELFDDVLSDCEQMAKDKGLNFIMKIMIADEQRYICSDKEKVTKILRHVMDNAFKFTHEGSVTVTCKVEHDDLVVVVTDSGIGISVEMQKVIFEPFRQVEFGRNRGYGGNGLGLAIVKSYVELLKGSVGVYSEVKRGTTLTITLPATKLDAPLVSKSLALPRIATVLVAEDELSNFQYLEELLGEYNIQIVHAKNGQQAVNICKSSQHIDLVLMDLKMPVMDGYEATRIIRELRPGLPIIAQTAYAIGNENEMVDSMFDDYITKPIYKDILLRKMSRFAQ